MKKFSDRFEAGKILSKELKSYEKKLNVIVLALPRGGVPVAYEIAKSLSVPLDVFIVRKLGMPGHEELAIGAIAMGGVTVFNDELLKTLYVPQSAINEVKQSELKELDRRNRIYRDNRPFPDLRNKTVILVDDGIATGATMRAAIKALRQLKPAIIILAIPVASPSTYLEMAKLVEKIICPLKPDDFYAVGQWYENFSQTTDKEVCALLDSDKNSFSKKNR
jgi:putative phosphoribosyl transferase